MAGKVFAAAGLLLLAAAGALVLWNLHEDSAAGETARQALAQVQQAIAAEDAPSGIESTPAPGAAPAPEMPAVEADGHEYVGTVEISALDLELPVLSDWSDELLKTAPCRYAGSVQAGDLVIAGHNYRAHFGRIGELQPGDQVFFTDASGGRTAYTVSQVESLPATAVEEMYDGGWALTPFTCTLAGADRVTVRCQRTGQP